MVKNMMKLCFKLYGKLYGALQRTSLESIVWGYRLFLDREPENPLEVANKLKRLASTQDIRYEFLNSDEYKRKNDTLRSLPLTGSEPAMPIEKVIELHDMFFKIQKNWEKLGEDEPYWSVITSDEFKNIKISETKFSFYESGLNDVTTFLKTMERNGIDHTSFKTCLEYGCGLGRVTSWLAKKFQTVIGYDISRSHLELARHYFDDVGIHNVALNHLRKPEEIKHFPKVDVVYSVIVLQHNPPPIIRLIIRELIGALNHGGIAFFQVPTYRLGYRFILNGIFR